MESRAFDEYFRRTFLHSQSVLDSFVTIKQLFEQAPKVYWTAAHNYITAFPTETFRSQINFVLI